jgi:protocatechuate 3,4-dioxygenase alpha subunit
VSAPTANQTVGPFFGIGMDWPGDADLTRDDPAGERLTLRGRVLDGAGEPVPDAVVEVWQADAEGRYRHPADPRSAEAAFAGRGRAPVDAAGAFEIRTIRPGRVPAPDGAPQAPHLSLTILARGLLRHLHTRVYFADETEANARDPVLCVVPAERRSTLIAEREGESWRLDVVLQGAGETVFFEL